MSNFDQDLLEYFPNRFALQNIAECACKLRKILATPGFNLKRESNKRLRGLLRKHQRDSDFLLSLTIFRLSFVWKQFQADGKPTIAVQVLSSPFQRTHCIPGE